METVEAGLTVPTPEEMAYEKLAEDVKEHDVGSEEETTVKGMGFMAWSRAARRADSSPR
jgi:hypothetical protein